MVVAAGAVAAVGAAADGASNPRSSKKRLLAAFASRQQVIRLSVRVALERSWPRSGETKRIEISPAGEMPIAERWGTLAVPAAMLNFKLDKKAFTVARRSDPPDDRAYWHSRTPEERLQAVEFLRQLNYGYDPSAERLQRVFEVVQRSSS